MIHGAKGLRTAGADWYNALLLRRGCFLEQQAEQLRVDKGHIAADDEGPFRFRDSQRGDNSACRAATGHVVRIDTIAEVRIAGGVSDEGGGPGRFLNYLCYVLRQRCSAARQKSFITPHTGTLAAHQHESGVAHEKIVASHIEAN